MLAVWKQQLVNQIEPEQNFLFSEPIKLVPNPASLINSSSWEEHTPRLVFTSLRALKGTTEWTLDKELGKLNSPEFFAVCP